MSYNFLDKTGLTYLWGKIKAYIGNKTIPLINGTQTTSTSAWTGVAPFSTLEDGQVINYYLPYASTSTAVTLNLTLSDGTTTGALPVYFNNGTERMTTHFGRGSSISLMYKASRVNSSGTTITNSWYFFSNRDTNSINQLRLENGGLYAGTNGIKKYSLCALDSDGKYQSFTTTSGTGTSKTINTSAKFVHPMTIYQNNANADYANDAVTGKYQIYNAVRADLRYSCNNFNDFVVNKPLYLECTKDADGFLSVTSNVMVQSGFVGGNYYVYLGEICNDAKYMLQLFPQHPTFYYTGQFFVDIVDWKVDKVDGMGLSECNYTTTDRNKLANIEAQATRVIVDSSLSNSSTNPVQNKVIANKFTDFENGVVTYVGQQISPLAPKASPALTGTPTAPTATAGTNTTQIATTAFVQTAVSGKVDKENGKGLSTNDFTNTLKTKLDSLPTRKVLYTATAFSNSITLSETKENFDEIEVFYEYNNVQLSSKFQVISGSQRTLLIYGWWDTTTSIAYQPQGITFSGTSVSYGHNAKANFTSGDSQMSYSGNNITITKIVGYKY